VGIHGMALYAKCHFVSTNACGDRPGGRTLHFAR
jgi:hypothetical protein